MKKIDKIVVALVAVLFAAVIGVIAANEININSTFKVTDGFWDYTRTVNATHSITAQAPNIAGGTILVSSNWTLVSVGNVATNGWAWFRNLATNGPYCQIGVTNAGVAVVPFMRLEIGETALMKLEDAGIYYARANPTTTVSIVLERVIVDK